MNFTPRHISEYLDTLLPKRDELMLEMEAHAAERRVPIVGPHVGALLYQVARMVGAKRVFEVGSAIGYSTLWFARAVADNGGGVVYFTEYDEERIGRARGYLGRDAKAAATVRFLEGDVRETLGSAEGPFDVVLLDVDKEIYVEMYERTAAMLRVGGVMVIDNVLWSGKVAHATVAGDTATAALKEFSARMARDERFVISTLPLRDGVMLAYRV